MEGGCTCSCAECSTDMNCAACSHMNSPEGCNCEGCTCKMDTTMPAPMEPTPAAPTM
ncbi:MAG: hypothetical protein ABI721_00750 [Candidatus Dojkabacteria bacterium]